MTFKVTILGSSAALPVRGRHHSAHALNVHEQFYLIDCGEGTQTRLVECGINPMKINAIFITHLHGDHFYGLGPLISSLCLMGRKTPLKIFAPAPFGELMENILKYLNSRLTFELQYHEINTREHILIYENTVMEVYSIPLRHSIPTAGYLFKEKIPPLNVRKDKIEYYKLGIAQIMAAKRGKDIILENGEVISNSKLTYTPYEPRSYAYCSDTAYSGKVAGIVRNTDLLYHEATFSAEDKAMAKDTGHSTSEQAAKLAATAEVGQLMIGHFSGRYKNLSQLHDEAKAIFPNTILAVEGQSVSIPLKRNL